MGGISIFAQTDLGRVRKGNEDSFFVVDTTSENSASLSEIRQYNLNEGNKFFMVADGMGGSAAGEVASLLAVNTVLKETKSKAVSTESEIVKMLDDSLQKANTAILEKASSNPEMRGMGTTATLAGISNNKLFIGQIGDSRAYIVRNDTITQVTKDQSLVDQLIALGTITEEEAEKHPQKNVILQALGSQASMQVAATSIELCQNDSLLLCSDGLSGLVKNEEMKSIVQSSSDLASASKELIDLANQRGGHDNITVIITHFSDKVFPSPDKNGAVTCKVISDYKPKFT
jgi:protein phosphatase